MHVGNWTNNAQLSSKGIMQFFYMIAAWRKNHSTYLAAIILAEVILWINNEWENC